MSRRRDTRFRDRYKCEVRPEIHTLPGEGWKKRHSRRLHHNLDLETEAQSWCEERAIDLRITNGGHHWQFTLPSEDLVEWWPSSAKMVKNKRWRDGMHVHDWTQAQAVLEKQLTK
jgi:hypothetical protein